MSIGEKSWPEISRASRRSMHSSRRILKLSKHPLLGLLPEGYDLLFGNGGKPIEKVRNRFACLQVIDQCLDRNTGALENGGSSHDLRIRTDDARLHTIFVGENGWKVKTQLTTPGPYQYPDCSEWLRGFSARRRPVSLPSIRLVFPLYNPHSKR